MRQKSILAALIVLAGAAAHPASAQAPLASAQLNFQYREPIGPDGDAAKARAAILSAAERDCATAEKAFGLTCSINSINFNNFDGGYGGFNRMPQGPQLSANVNAVLEPRRADGQN